MKILGLDPGPKMSAWVIWDDNEKRVIQCCYELNNHILERFNDQASIIEIDRIHVEVPEKHGRPIWSELILTAIEAGRFVYFAESWGITLVKVTARKWRQQVIGQPSPSDAVIKKILGLRFDLNAWGVKNSHLRDALGVALYKCNLRVKAEEIA